VYNRGVKFIHTDLGNCERGDVVLVELSAWANVQLMSTTDFNNYRGGRRYRYQGGLVKQSPFRMTVPSDGQWHVAIDNRGLSNPVRGGARVISRSALRPLPAIQQQRDTLRQIADNFADAAPDHEVDTREFDVFISHASEDKDDIVRPLAHALKARGLEVWYDEFVLKIGDSLRRKIDEGISRSKFGLVVFSEFFFAKGWPQHELDGLVTMSVDGRQILLPVWHKITKDEVVKASPSLADKVALRTADYGVEEIADEVAAVIRGD
jgi:hypothetical protein